MHHNVLIELITLCLPRSVEGISSHEVDRLFCLRKDLTLLRILNNTLSFRVKQRAFGDEYSSAEVFLIMLFSEDVVLEGALADGTLYRLEVSWRLLI